MKRYKYNLNCQTFNNAKFFRIVPLNYIEVVPGDTISGTLKTRLVSDLFTKIILNRAYMDLYAFYVPYRVLDDTWPDVVAGNGGSVPTVTDTFPQNFEHHIVGTTENTAWQRYCYNLCFNKFFSEQGGPDSPLTGNSLNICHTRPSTFHEAVRTSSDINDTTIDVSGGTLSLRELEEAKAEARFDKVRDFYGSKYADFLAAMGVKANWSVLDEPELIGQKHSDLRFVTRNNTSATDTGGPVGYYDGVVTLPVKRTFCPEHGLIAFYAIPKVDLVQNCAAGPANLAKLEYDDYWSPERNTRRDKFWPGKLFCDGTPSGSFVTGPWTDLQKGMNLHTEPVAVNQTTNYVATLDVANASVNTFRTPSHSTVSDLVAGYLDPEGSCDFVLATESNIQKQSPVPPMMK